MSKKEMSPSSQLAFDMAKIFLDIETKSFKSGMKYAKEDAERERKLQAFADKCERDIEEKPIKMSELQKAIATIFEFIERTQVGDWQELKNSLEELEREEKTNEPSHQ